MWATRGVTRADGLQNSKIGEDTFTSESIKMSTDTEDSCGLDYVCRMQRFNIVRQAYKQ